MPVMKLQECQLVLSKYFKKMPISFQEFAQFGAYFANITGWALDSPGCSLIIDSLRFFVSNFYYLSVIFCCYRLFICQIATVT